MSSGEELKFQKLSEVELLEKAPGTAHALAEVDGRIKRVAGGVGGGGGNIYVWDVTEYIDPENLTTELTIPMTVEEAEVLVAAFKAAQGVQLKYTVSLEGGLLELSNSSLNSVYTMYLQDETQEILGCILYQIMLGSEDVGVNAHVSIDYVAQTAQADVALMLFG